MTWTCPECGRSFGRAQQSHGCAPAMTVDRYFAGRPPGDRAIFDAVARCVAKLGPVTVEAVKVGIFIKRSRTFAELRPRRGGLMLAMLLSRTVADRRIAKTLKTSAHRVVHYVPLARPGEVDAEVRGWLAEAYASSPE